MSIWTSPRSSASRTCSPTACCRWAFLGRLVTSYAPRDRIRRLGTRFTSITWVGDVITLSGKVTGKREENGEKLIDLEVKCTNQNGQDTLQGHATVAAA